MTSEQSEIETRSVPARVVVGCTATLHGKGAVRLPDRLDHEGPIAAFLVETAEDARWLLRELDEPGRTLFVDVERKQEADLPALALECVQHAELRPHKPNDATIRSLDVLVTHLIGFDLRSVSVGVVGTGNLGFKAALLLAERGADVVVHGRNPVAAQRTVTAVSAVLPRHSTCDVAVWQDQQADLLVTALSARSVVDAEWVERIRPGATVIDVGIGNLTTDFVRRALADGLALVRLDTRATGSQLVAPAPDFFDKYFGEAELAGVSVVSGGVVGPRGAVVVDSYARPTQVFGLADGLGGLLSPDAATPREQGRRDVVEALVRHREAGD